jgi:hypothetical protein
MVIKQSIILVLVALSSAAQLLTAVKADVSFSLPTPLERVRGDDLLPTALQAGDGTLWVAWQSNRYSGLTGRYDILYKTMSGGVWSQTVNFTTSGWNAAPSLAQLQNGTILLFWANNRTGNYDIYYRGVNGGHWSAMAQLSSSPGDDTLPSASVSRDGTLWISWSRTIITCSSACSVTKQLYYRTLKNGAWTLEVQLTSDPTLNFSSSVMVAKDGRVWVVWSKWTNDIYQVFYKTYNGTWTSDKQLVTSSLLDTHPSLVQDRNGTLWLFWARDLSAGLGLFEFDIFNKSSFDNGLTWSAERQMTVDPVGYIIDDKMPVAVQASDRSLWLFYSSDLSEIIGGDYDIYYMKSALIYPIHDVTVYSIRSSTPLLYPGGLKSINQSAIVRFNVTVANTGDFPEILNLQLRAVNTTSYLIGSLSKGIASSSSLTFSFAWNTTRVIPARYTMVAVISPLPGETIGDLGDNTLSVSNVVHILPLGDLNQDGTVGFMDALTFAADYGATKGSPRYDPYADINGNGVIDFLDATVLASNYGIRT